ncbi:MAG: hypothetical protein A2051_08025 [Desulfovibrionales bacterium GWA2_65_9]|nr:MAG: hypothetical protein A2051_08025 [Desulfovibrionales bacterium GWA2_65_9]
MNLPEKTHQGWHDLVTGRKVSALKSLAVRMLLGRLTLSVQEDSSPENIAASIDQLYEVFAKNAHTPSIQEDLKTIFG